MNNFRFASVKACVTRIEGDAMKNNIITTLIAAVAMVAATPVAEAQRHYHHHHHSRGHHASYVFISGYHRCGTPIYTERYIIRYDRRSRPVYGYRPVRYRPHYVRPAPRGYRVAPCPPPRRSSGYISIRF